MCRWTGPAHHIGQLMCWCVICDNDEYLATSAVIAVDEPSMESNEMKNQMTKFTKNLEAKIGNSIIPTFEMILWI